MFLEEHALSFRFGLLVLIEVDRQQLGELLVRLTKAESLLVLLVAHIKLDSLLWLASLDQDLDILLS